MVSLIIPCYNCEKYIARCLESVLKQSDKDIELILVNDGSTDKTSEIIEGYSNSLKNRLTKFIYIEQTNQGVGAACNVAFKRVTGKYLTLLDSDDVMFPDSILTRRQWLDNHPQYDIVRTNGFYVTEDNVNLCKQLFEVNDFMKNKENIFEEVFDGSTYVWPGTYMIRMSILENIYPNREIYPSRSGQNLQFLMTAAYKSRSGFIDKPLLMYLVRKDSLSHFSSGDVLNKEMSAIEGYKDIRKHLIKEIMPKEEQDMWNYKIEKLYAKVYLLLALKHKNKQLAEYYYNNLKFLCKGQPDLNLQISYYKLENPIMYIYLRILRKLRCKK